jgi:hypothetical protein
LDLAGTPEWAFLLALRYLPVSRLLLILRGMWDSHLPLAEILPTASSVLALSAVRRHQLQLCKTFMIQEDSRLARA